MQVTASGQAFLDVYPQAAGLERFVYQTLRELRCAPFLREYIKV